MWSPFNFIKKKRIERERRIQEQKHAEEAELKKRKTERKRVFLERKTYIDNIVQGIYRQQEELSYDYAKKAEARNIAHNKTCPNCKSTNICKVYNRQQGSLNGKLNSHSSSHSSFGLFHGSTSHYNNTHGTIYGELDTIRVNKCNSCNHEWEYRPEIVMSTDWYPGKIDYARDVPRFMDKVYYLLEDSRKFDPDDLSETCSTLEEWIKKHVTNIRDGYEEVFDLELEVLFYYARRFSFDIVNEEEIFGYDWRNAGDSETERYISSFAPEIERVLIEWFGFKKHFE